MSVNAYVRNVIKLNTYKPKISDVLNVICPISGSQVLFMIYCFNREKYKKNILNIVRFIRSHQIKG